MVEKKHRSRRFLELVKFHAEFSAAVLWENRISLAFLVYVRKQLFVVSHDSDSMLAFVSLIL